MKRQRGIADGWILLTFIVLIIGGLVTGLGYIKGFGEREYTRGKQEVQARFDLYQREVVELGRAAQERADKQAAADKAAKEKANAKHKDLERQRDAARRELRNERARGSVLPAPAPTARGGDETLTFDRKRLDEALNRFIDRVEAIVGEGAEAVDDLKTVREWAQQ